MVVSFEELCSKPVSGFADDITWNWGGGVDLSEIVAVGPIERRVRDHFLIHFKNATILEVSTNYTGYSESVRKLQANLVAAWLEFTNQSIDTDKE